MLSCDFSMLYPSQLPQSPVSKIPLFSDPVPWDVPWYTTRERCITILYHAIENIVANQCDIRAAHDEKVGCNSVEYTTAFPYSYWLYFLWHGINTYIYLPLKQSSSQSRALSTVTVVSFSVLPSPWSYLRDASYTLLISHIRDGRIQTISKDKRGWRESELIFHTELFPKVIPLLKLFLDMVPSSPADNVTTRAGVSWRIKMRVKRQRLK